MTSAAPAEIGVRSNNNFDLLRLFAATQVLITHLIIYIVKPTAEIGQSVVGVFMMFPGVPIFFVISGFLVSKSYENCSSITLYARNRALRIYPALWTCLGVSLLTAFLLSKEGSVQFALGEFLLWLPQELVFGHTFPSGIFVSYGVGKLNGALWTIPIELQFYVAVPLVYLVARWAGKTAFNGILCGMIAASWGIGYYVQVAVAAEVNSRELLLLKATCLPYLYMFLLGVFVQRNYGTLRRYLEGKGGWWVLGYVILCVTLRKFSNATVGSNSPNFATLVVLACTVIAVAYTMRSLSHRLLKENDLSYGIYIYHLVVINVWVEHQWRGTVWHALSIAAVVVALSSASWWLLERPMLRLKKRSLRQV